MVTFLFAVGQHAGGQPQHLGPGRDQVRLQLEVHVQGLGAHSGRDHGVVAVADPVLVGEQGDAGVRRIGAGLAEGDVVREDRRDDVQLAGAELLGQDRGTGRVGVDVVAELFQVRPGLAPAVGRIGRVRVARAGRGVLR